MLESASFGAFLELHRS